MTDTTKHKHEDQPKNPYDEASVLSKVFFFWLNPFIKEGFKKDLTLMDLYQVPKEDLSKDLGQTLKREWDKELRLKGGSRRPSLGRAICRAFGFWYLLSGIWVTLGECIVRPLQAISLGWIIRDGNAYLAMPVATTDPLVLNEAYYRIFYDGLILIALSIIALITVHPYVFCTQHTGMKVRVACCHLIYRHSLKLSNAAIGQTTVGQMVNLLTNDVQRFDIALNFIQYLVIAPLQAVIAVAVLSVFYLGFYSTIAGSIILLLYIPFQYFMGQWNGRLRQATASRTDERIRLMNELIPAMRVIKMYTWEDPFATLVEVARKREVRLIRYTSILKAINMALFFVSSKIILFIIFITYVLLGYTLEPETVFVAITLFNAVRLFMTLFFPYGMAQLAETVISCNRLQEFLMLPEQEGSKRVIRETPDKKDDIEVMSSDASAYWTLINKTFAVPADDPNKTKTTTQTTTTTTTTTSGKTSSSSTTTTTTTNDNQNNSPKTSQQLPRVNQQNGGSRGELRASTQLMNNSMKNSSSLFLSANIHLSSDKLNGMEQTGITALQNITYNVKAGELLVILGSVGSGKSSVLMSILGELPLSSGQMRIKGKISYSSQEPWIFAGSVKENVLFGKAYDEKRYQQVLTACSLDRDVKLFPYGDETVVGERGVSLSGGQRARINLARAIYYDADIYLLDDPLSAVDTLVAKHMFNECICGFLKDKAVILATHQTQFVKKDTKVLFLDKGRQISCKSYADNKSLQSFIGSTWERSDSESAMSGAKHNTSGRRSVGHRNNKSSSLTGSTATNTSTSRLALDSSPALKAGSVPASAADDKQPLLAAGNSSSSASDSEDPDGGDAPPNVNQITGESPMKQQPESTNDKVGCAIYWHYVRSSSALVLVFIIAVSNVGTQVLFNGSDFWLSYWTDTEQRKAAAGGTSDYEPVTLTDTLTLRQNATIYAILIGSLFALTLVRTTCFFIACTRSSINLHNKLFRSVLRAPIKFFDYTPIGILLNRVSRDMGIVDDLLPPTAFDTIEIFINVLGILVTVTIVYPMNAIPAVILCLIVGILRMFYIRTVRSIKSIEGVTKSPVFSHLATSLNGLATIRAFKVEPEFERRFDHYQDVHSSAWFIFVAAARWLGCTLDWICIGYIGVITILMTLTIGSTTGSQIGLAISSALALSGSFQWGVRQSTEMESQMTSVARIKEFSELPEEPPRTSPAESRPAPSWPERGAIKFQHVNLRYFENEEPVLKDLNFQIREGEKVGIVGRTGAGKSSIIAVLFRLTEPEGSIEIDGIDTKSIGLHELRKKLSIIPQEPILFNGPVRRNLDPFEEYQDADLWSSLEKADLKQAIKELPGGLDAELKEGGSNFSVGQRQLICLARAILRKNRIIILDEATANVDKQTDKFIQKTIDRSFASCTRLTIAHRLDTIMESDRVLVMDAGQAREFDEPHLLLQNRSSIFSTMVKNTGKNEGRLREKAEHHYKSRHAGSGGRLID